MCRRVWLAFMEQVFLSEALPIPMTYLDSPETWARVRWVPQGWPYLHPVQDVDADQKAIRNGFTSRAAVVSEHGDDVEEIDQQQREDNDRADRLGLKHDSDGRQSLKGAAPANGVEDTQPQAEGAQQQ